MVKKRKVKVNLGRALKTLVHVHGLQLMMSGVYNADPHVSREFSFAGIFDHVILCTTKLNSCDPLLYSLAMSLSFLMVDLVCSTTV